MTKKPLHLVHLTASTLYGGPERQMLGLADALCDRANLSVMSFREGGKCRPFLAEAAKRGLEAIELHNDSPRFLSAAREIAQHLTRLQADALLCHGYKANLIGRMAARWANIPAIGVSRGWTGENWKVRLYESVDRMHLRMMDHVVGVSQAQADKIHGCSSRLSVIHNAIDPDRFADPDPRYRTRIERYFTNGVCLLIGAAGRLSPEKGFDILIDAAAEVCEQCPEVGFVLFGDGPCKSELQTLIHYRGLSGSFVLAGHRTDLDKCLPTLDLFVQSSYTEGLPNVLLEACAAGVPVVATTAGGTPEIIEDEVNGWLVPPGNSTVLAQRILDAIDSPERMAEVAFNGRQTVLERFSFREQALAYIRLVEKLTGKSVPTTPSPEASWEH
jgi:glycosyltransferase involved in cell wall biosynthesis